MIRNLLICLALPFLWGCATPMSFVEFSSGDRLSGDFDRGKGEIRVIMPDGETLSGIYRITSKARFSIGASLGKYGKHTGIGVSPRVSIPSRKQVYALIGSPTSNLLMEVILDYNRWTGGGHGEAITNDGREFKVIF